MHITSKGQVTIPQTIREKVGLLPGGEVDFVLRGNSVLIRAATKSSRRGQAVVNHLRTHGGTRVQMSTDEIMALTRR